ncbi:hypothetical protein GRF29_1536g335859 [Pseudopithomyces chartarum]|uniref:Ubiquitin-like-conjugating enzyme ATG10 n=1 Tax=Pseudopithomyces chartarum TaxID=1892770 RepID=A0AAN6LL18_9PLEO|nr:hypothetical protein GRF29_1536g335859 [Pseudopithomyces chartarum]
MDPVASLLHLSNAEFHSACTALVESYDSLNIPSATAKWTSVEIRAPYGTHILRITRELPQPKEQGTHVQVPTGPGNPHDPPDDDDSETPIQEDDDEAMITSHSPSPLIHYDILLSPTYRVPTLYIHISDPLHRFPPTMSTLYTHVIHPACIDQTKTAGVMGGITIADHPVENRPVFFVHPCRTAEVMEAISGGRKMLPFDYLLMWIGAMGKSVGLEVPIEMVAQGKKKESV